MTYRMEAISTKLSHLQDRSLLQAFNCDFLPARRYDSVIFVATASPSIRLSQVDVLLRWLNVKFQKHRRKIVQRL